MTITQERITPEMAKEYLGMNTDNYRKLNNGRVLTYSADMKNGKWQMNGESIKFSENGALMDGQPTPASVSCSMYSSSSVVKSASSWCLTFK